MATFPSTVANQPVSLCAADLRSRLQSIAAVKNKNLFVFDEDDLMDKIKGVQLPGVGVVYEGMKSLGESGNAKLGLSAELVFSLLIISRAENLANVDSKTPMLNLLDEIRKSLVSTRSPTGHYWKFVVEAATRESKGAVFWVQRWSTTIHLTQ